MKKAKTNHRTTCATALLAAVALLTGACSQDSPAGGQDRELAVPLQLSSGIANVTRASGTAWESGDQIGVFTTVAGNTTTSTVSGTIADANVLYQIDNTVSGYASATEGSLANAKAFKPTGNPIYLPADGSNVDVYAYHPYQAGTVATSMSVAVTAQSTPKVIDLLTASVKTTASDPVNAQHPKVALLFTHRLSKVTINVKAGPGYQDSEITGQTAVTLSGTPTSAAYNLYTDALSTFSAAADITPAKQSAATTGYLETYEAILLPNESGNSAAAGRTLTFKVGDTANGYYHYTIPSDKVFQRGENTIYNITLSPTGLNVTASIQEWSTVDEPTQVLK